MPKTIVTAELADTLKMIRLQNGIQAKVLAQHIGKSAAYISKLEKGEIKTIENDLIDTILRFIIKDDSEGNLLAEKIYSSMQLKFTKKEIEEQIWFANYDTVYRRIPIPTQLIEELNKKLISLNISRQLLLKRINANEALPESEIADETIDYNQWYSPNGDGQQQSIKMKLSEEIIDSILDLTVTSAPYVVVFSIAFYLLKIERFGEQVFLEENENHVLMRETSSLLNKFKFYSLVEKNHMLANAETEEQIHNLLSSFDNENRELVSSILSHFKITSELNITLTNERLKSFNQNLDWDCWFMLRLISLSFTSLEELYIDRKKEFLVEVERLIEKYKNSPASQKIETY